MLVGDDASGAAAERVVYERARALRNGCGDARVQVCYVDRHGQLRSADDAPRPPTRLAPRASGRTWRKRPGPAPADGADGAVAVAEAHRDALRAALVAKKSKLSFERKELAALGVADERLTAKHYVAADDGDAASGSQQQQHHYRPFVPEVPDHFFRGRAAWDVERVYSSPTEDHRGDREYRYEWVVVAHDDLDDRALRRVHEEAGRHPSPPRTR